MGVVGIESFQVPYFSSIQRYKKFVVLFLRIKSNRFSDNCATSLIARKGATCNSHGAGIVRCIIPDTLCN